MKITINKALAFLSCAAVIGSMTARSHAQADKSNPGPAMRQLLSEAKVAGAGQLSAPKAVAASSVADDVRSPELIIRVYLQTTNGIESVQYSPDGKRILTHDGYDGIVWDAVTGEERLTLEKPDHYVVLSVKYSPNGERIVITDTGSNGYILDAATGKKRLTLPLASVPAEYSPNGKRIVTASDHGNVIEWNADTGEKRLTLKHGNSVVSAKYSPDGKRILTTHNDTIVEWDADTGQELLTPKEDYGHLIDPAQYSPDGKRILMIGRHGAANGTAVVLDADTGKELLALRKNPGGSKTPGDDHGSWCSFAQYSPNGKRIATTSHDGTGIVWDAVTGEKRFTTDGEIRYSPDGKLLIMISHPMTAIAAAAVLDADTGRKLLTLESGDSFYMHFRDNMFSPDSKHILLQISKDAAAVWDVTGRRSSQARQNRAPERASHARN